MEFRPAQLVDYAALFPDQPRRTWKAARVQLLSGPAWTLWHEGEPQLICGLYPLHSGILEAWLMMPRRKPGPALLHHLLIRALTIMPERTVIARIDDRHAPGKRLAVMAGFVPIAEFLPETRIRTWVRPALAENSPS